MKCYVGIDLGSTTTKAMVIGAGGEILGRGITNSRSNYTLACDVALGEALIDARFGLVGSRLDAASVAAASKEALLASLERRFREQQYLGQLEVFREAVAQHLTGADAGGPVSTVVDEILKAMEAEVSELYAEGARRKSDFFRDLAGSRWMERAEAIAREDRSLAFDRLAGLFDKTILEVENTPPALEFGEHARAALARLEQGHPALTTAVEEAAAVELDIGYSAGTGYGRQTLPFDREAIRSEILCHGLGAHAMFPATRTVLDIGGQDTKAIQVDENGIVTSFQMNDRCAAGCGRYLGYIADEMNVGVHELGPIASRSTRRVRINSTCTVFAGAELRERLSLGEKREDILAGLHRSIILRAMSLIARSGGIHDQFTFTGGVANNNAAVGALNELVTENYGEVTTNISLDSIYTGALGAALFASRSSAARAGQEADA